ncbi:MAG: BadF/BadG/BcrA/BcrD ATPase family protein [Planctomycetota bacterium]
MAIDSRSPPLFLGVDSGGTKTRAICATVGTEGRLCIQGIGVGGPGNPLSSGIDAATNAIAAATRQALDDARVETTLPQRGVFAVAGAAHEASRQELTDRLNSLGLADHCEVVPDYTPLFATAEPDLPAAAIVIGTGSVVFVRDATGNIFRSGGWGYLLGDEASGYAIGKAAVQVTLRAHEHGLPMGEVGHLVLTQLGCPRPDDLLKTIYAAADSRRLLASLAKGIFQLEPNDAAAAQIIAEAGEEFSQTVERALQTAGIGEAELRVEFTGSVALASESFRQRILQPLKTHWNIGAKPLLLRDPAEACLHMAAAIA